jgi:aspartyl-tRNA(Asn)/glutamyl-tRNA(Gln) amidotransferase subunit B
MNADEHRWVPLLPRSQVEPAAVNLTEETAISAALAGRPDLKAARLREEMAEAGIDLAKAQIYPTIGVSVHFSSDKLVLEDLHIAGSRYVEKDREVSLGVSIPLPLFNRQQGAIAERVSQRMQAKAQREATELSIRREVAAAYRSYHAAAQQTISWRPWIWIEPWEGRMETMSTSFADLAPPEVIAKYEPVIGLEVHVQLATATKIFCGCPTSFGAPPNTNVCPVCLGMPGALPVLNRLAVELAIKAGIALNCTIRPMSRFARKNYFYPDLPKGYQISQYDEPLAEHGWVEIEVDGARKRIGVTRVHMEDDAGKSLHEGFKDSDRYTYVDLNRSGTPLIEIVSEPDMRSSAEAYAYLAEVKQVLQFIEVSTCDMEKGHLRCDANVSVRLRGAEKFGTKAEVKNLNSFRFLRQALDHEIARQVAILEGGGKIVQETRLFNPDTGETAAMRSKEHAHDYRYFPEPDLAPLCVSESWLAEVKAQVPELAAVKRARFLSEYGLREYDADVLTATRATSEYFEKAASVAGDPRAAANWVMGDLMGALKAGGREISDSPVSPEHLGELLKLVGSGEISNKLAKEIFPKMFASGEAASAIIERDGLKQISDTGALEKIVDEVMAANPKQLEQYRAGKTTVMGFFVGQVMRATKGQANPAAVNELLKKKL